VQAIQGDKCNVLRFSPIFGLEDFFRCFREQLKMLCRSVARILQQVRTKTTRGGAHF